MGASEGFAERYPVSAIVGVDDDTTVLRRSWQRRWSARTTPWRPSSGALTRTLCGWRWARLREFCRRHSGFCHRPGSESVRRAGRYPCVLKPLSLAASRGVIRADNAQAFAKAFEEIVSILAVTDLTQRSRRTQILSRSSSTAIEVSLEGLLIDGALTTLALFDKPTRSTAVLRERSTSHSRVCN